MTTPRYVPRDYIADGYRPLFGKTAKVPWAPQDSQAREEQLEAARLQHVYAVVIRNKIKTEYGSIRAYAKAAHQDQQRLARVLRGRTVMRLDDIGTAAVLLGDVHASVWQFLSQSPPQAPGRRQATSRPN